MEARRAFVSITFSLLLAPVGRSAEAVDSISDFRVVHEAGGTMVVSVAYNYDSAHGDNVLMGVDVQTAAGASVIVSFSPWQVHAGTGRAYVALRYSRTSTITSARVEVFMYEGANAPFITRNFTRSKTWTRVRDDVLAETFRTLSQTARDLTYQATYTLQSTRARPVRMGAASLRNGVRSVAHGYTPSARLARGTRLTAGGRLSFVGSGVDASDAILLYLYEESGSPFFTTVVPRVKYWSSTLADRDGDGISDANEFALRTNDNQRDSDGDGLEDGWELEGYRWDGSQYYDSNLPLLGANPRHRDVFVELDYIVDSTGGTRHDHKMHLESIHKAKQLYGQLSIANNDLRNGVDVHILHNGAIEFDGALGGVCGMRRFISHFPERKRRIYHWSIAGHGTGGQSEPPPSNRFVFGTGNGNPPGGSMSTVDKFIGYAIFAHELGHNLGLQHAGTRGTDQTNCKANYPSLMNYAYDYSFNCSPYNLATTQIQFSRGLSPRLDEPALRELGNFGLAHVRGYDSDFLGCNSFRVSGSSIDWNRNGSYQAGTVAVDFTAVAPSCGDDGVFQSNQVDSTDTSTLIAFIDDSIRTPGLTGCEAAGPTNGFLHDADTEDGFEPVCGLPRWETLSEHPFLNVNPVVDLQPGLPIVHPELRRLLEPALDRTFNVRFDAPLKVAPEVDPRAFDAPLDLLSAPPQPDKKSRGPQ